MDPLTQCREEIDRIDAQMIALFERRMAVAREIAEIKKRANMPVLQAGREKAVLDKCREQLKDKALWPSAQKFMQYIMQLSREEQNQRI